MALIKLTKKKQIQDNGKYTILENKFRTTLSELASSRLSEKNLRKELMAKDKEIQRLNSELKIIKTQKRRNGLRLTSESVQEHYVSGSSKKKSVIQ